MLLLKIGEPIGPVTKGRDSTGEGDVIAEGIDLGTMGYHQKEVEK